MNNWFKIFTHWILTISMLGKDKANLKKVSVNLPFGIGGAEWESDETERVAAWSLYVELITRITVQPLETDKGGLREAMNSLYQLFPTTREILRTAGPNIGAARTSVGGIAIAVLNVGVRPFLTKWHSSLADWESLKPTTKSSHAHELEWPDASVMRVELANLQTSLLSYAEALAKIAEVQVN